MEMKNINTFKEFNESKTNLDFGDYSEALLWIKERAKDYESINDFYASDEYKSIYPLIQQMYEVEKSKFIKVAEKELEKAGLKIGDKVEYDFVSPFFDVTKYKGKLVNRKGIPYVKFVDNMTTMNGKKSVRWHKGFKKSK